MHSESFVKSAQSDSLQRAEQLLHTTCGNSGGYHGNTRQYLWDHFKQIKVHITHMYVHVLARFQLTHQTHTHTHLRTTLHTNKLIFNPVLSRYLMILIKDLPM